MENCLPVKFAFDAPHFMVLASIVTVASRPKILQINKKNSFVRFSSTNILNISQFKRRKKKDENYESLTRDC